MTKRTIASRLKSYAGKVADYQNHEDWYTNPRELPLPSLPGIHYLQDQYLREIAVSAPSKLSALTRLIAIVRQVRESEITYRGRKESHPEVDISTVRRVLKPDQD